MAQASKPEPEPEHDATETSLVQVSKSRVRVLKALDGQRRTVSELARDLELNKSTVHGYVQDLVQDGLVNRHEDEERLWVYYSLTDTGEHFVRNERLTIVVDLATVVSFLGALALGLYRFLNPPAPSGGAGTLGGPDPSSGAGGLPWLMIGYIGLGVLALVGAGLHVYLTRRRREVLT